MSTIPTSDFETFKKQVSKPNTGFDDVKQEVQREKINKNIVLVYNSDFTGCGHIRTIVPALYLNAVFGRANQLQCITTTNMIYQEDILKRTRSILFQRTMGPQSIGVIQHYKELQKKYKFKMVYDIDDFIWTGDLEGEDIPDYNFGKRNITPIVQQSSIDNMKLMDQIMVTSQFLKDYIASFGIDPNKITIVHNTMPSFLWGSDKKQPITERITKPTIIWSASPTHWHNGEKLYGDMDNAWREWVIRNVNLGKINYVQMGGCPWFFEEIRDKIKVIDWVDSLHYPGVVKSVNADFGISPLVPNHFNYSKSPIKYQEYCVSGIVGIGTVFTNGKPSPYDISQVRTEETVTVDQLDQLFFNHLCKPEVYNDILEKQYQQVRDENWILESSGFINMLTKII